MPAKAKPSMLILGIGFMCCQPGYASEPTQGTVAHAAATLHQAAETVRGARLVETAQLSAKHGASMVRKAAEVVKLLQDYQLPELSLIELQSPGSASQAVPGRHAAPTDKYHTK